jgi:hypothetical protein
MRQDVDVELLLRSPLLAAGRLAAASLVAVMLAACSPGPTGTPAPGGSRSAATTLPSGAPAWSVADVRLTSQVTEEPPSLAPGIFCSPCHPPAQNLFFGLAASSDELLAVGVQQPPAQPIVFASADGRSWASLAELPGDGPGSALAVVATTSRTVIVGSAGQAAASWASASGGPWLAAPAQSALEGPSGGNAAMTSVAALGGQVIAAGYIDDPASGSQTGAVWRSRDGLTWSLDESSATFAGAQILGLAVKGSTIVAVGTLGDPTYGSAAAWWWSEGQGWRRAEVGGSDGAMRAVTATTGGFVAVGHGPGDHGAATWTSSDGSAWEPASDQPAFHHGDSAVRMLSVTAGPGVILAGGLRQDIGNGAAAAWLSSDGTTWREFDWVPSFSGGEMAAVAIWRDLLVGAGRTGYPDNNQATVWVHQGD